MHFTKFGFIVHVLMLIAHEIVSLAFLGVDTLGVPFLVLCGGCNRECMPKVGWVC
jgi:hypothetical protein